MPTARVNGVSLFYTEAGSGDVPLVLVHGSWTSHRSWDLVTPEFARSFRVVTYDRRGHSQSERPAGQGSVREDVADLAALIEHLGLAPTYVAGNSFGASIALRLLGERPDLVRGLVVHEPPLLALLAGDPELAPLLAEVQRRSAAVIERIDSGDEAGAAEQFVETIALGPGTWAQLPPEIQRTFVENAQTFADETRDPELFAIDPASLRSAAKPVLLTLGEQSPPMFGPVVQTLAGMLPHAETRTFRGAGHVPHLTHPEVYVQVLTSFVQTHEE